MFAWRTRTESGKSEQVTYIFLSLEGSSWCLAYGVAVKIGRTHLGSRNLGVLRDEHIFLPPWGRFLISSNQPHSTLQSSLAIAIFKISALILFKKHIYEVGETVVCIWKKWKNLKIFICVHVCLKERVAHGIQKRTCLDCDFTKFVDQLGGLLTA